MNTDNSATTILVVDDDPDNCTIVVHLLERQGYHTRTAYSGPDALAIVRTEPVDLVLLDVMMPEMDGFQVCSALRELEPGKTLPIILLTAWDDIDARLGAMHHGASEFLTKPVNKHELIARVQSQLHIRALTRQLDEVEHRLEDATGRTPSER